MNSETLINGYRSILNTIYSPRQYYDRVTTFLKEYHPPRPIRPRIDMGYIFNQLGALIRTTWLLGFVEKGRDHFWKGYISTLFKKPKFFPTFISLAVYGYHFRKVMEKYIKLPVRDSTS
jgi:hypothetical protein